MLAIHGYTTSHDGLIHWTIPPLGLRTRLGIFMMGTTICDPLSENRPSGVVLQFSLRV